MQHAQLPVAEVDDVSLVQDPGQRSRRNHVVGGAPARLGQSRDRLVHVAKHVGEGEAVVHGRKCVRLEARAGAISELVQRSDMVGMDVGGDRKDRLARRDVEFAG